MILNDDRFNISAKVPPGATKEQLKLMLQNLLSERFKLAFHFEKKELQIYDLVVAKGGLKMKESPPEPPPPPKDDNAAPAPPPRPANMGKMPMGPDGFPVMPPPRRNSQSMSMVNGRFRWVITDCTIPSLISQLTGQVGRPITDATGVTGKYDVTLIFALETTGGRGAAMPAPSEGGALAIPSDSDAGPTIFAALQEQLGLKLEQKKGAVDMLVFDHVEKMPTEN
jgi:uncharacterized protein (TIGR03435 family)